MNGSARTAVVLSGGGAKCSYQAGAVIEIEANLAELNERRAKKNKEPVDIDLVVGTSGGAINALLVAAGVWIGIGIVPGIPLAALTWLGLGLVTVRG